MIRVIDLQDVKKKTRSKSRNSISDTNKDSFPALFYNSSCLNKFQDQFLSKYKSQQQGKFFNEMILETEKDQQQQEVEGFYNLNDSQMLNSGSTNKKYSLKIHSSTPSSPKKQPLYIRVKEMEREQKKIESQIKQKTVKLNRVILQNQINHSRQIIKQDIQNAGKQKKELKDKKMISQGINIKKYRSISDIIKDEKQQNSVKIQIKNPVLLEQQFFPNNNLLNNQNLINSQTKFFQEQSSFNLNQRRNTLNQKLNSNIHTNNQNKQINRPEIKMENQFEKMYMSKKTSDYLNLDQLLKQFDSQKHNKQQEQQKFLLLQADTIERKVRKQTQRIELLRKQQQSDKTDKLLFESMKIKLFVIKQAQEQNFN